MYVAMHSCALQCVDVCRSALGCVVVCNACCSGSVLMRVAVC